MDLVLVRHGETQWNVDGRFRGRAEVPLSVRGRQQATATAERTGEWQPDAIYASPVVRAAETAARIANELRIETHIG
jgi:broad specificity phosphatase PhoE